MSKAGRRTIPVEQRATREAIWLYRSQYRIIDLAIEHDPTLKNCSEVVRAALGEYGEQHLKEELDMDDAAEAEQRLEAFKQKHGGLSVAEVKAARQAESERVSEAARKHDEEQLTALCKSIEQRERRGTFYLKNYVEGNIEKGRFTFDGLSLDDVCREVLKRIPKDNREGWQ
jgi:hypothetical protein